MPKENGPLKESDLPLLNRLIAKCEETLRECAKCEKCNLDVTPEKQKTEDQLETAKRIKATYFPTSK